MEYDTEKTQATSDIHVGIADPRRHARLQDEANEYLLKDTADGGSCPVARRPVTDSEILAKLFAYYPPTPHTLPKHAAINQAAKNFAEVVLQNCPPSADRTDAIRKIRETRATANAAIALNGLSL